MQPLGYLDLDLPDAPEKAARPPPQPVDSSSKYGPRAEITHIFRSPDKRPPTELSFAFLGLVLLPLGGFLIGVGCGFMFIYLLFCLSMFTFVTREAEKRAFVCRKV